MVHLPTIQDEQRVKARPTHFIQKLKFWLGRLVSAAAHLSFDLYELIRKIELSTQPLLLKTSQTKSFSLPQAREEDKILDEEGQTILHHLFERFGLASDQNILTQGIIFTLQGEKQQGIEPKDLNGAFQIEWDLVVEDEDDPIMLIYKGSVQNGLLHGEGSFRTLDKKGALHLILEGTFQKGTFISGRFVTPHALIEGQFIRGQSQGVGTIVFLDKGEETEQLQYIGSFADGAPHGRGKMLALSPQGVEIRGEGEFVNGIFHKGHLQKEGVIYNGEFFGPDQQYFKGKVTDALNSSEYEGEMKVGYPHGLGRWVTQEKTPPHKELRAKSGKEKKLTVKKVEDVIERIRTGEFREGELYQGGETVKWLLDGKTATSDIVVGKVCSTVIEIHRPSPIYFGSKYIGRFELGTLDGKGSIYNAEGQEIYRGKIKGGQPHGVGLMRNSNGEWSEANFQWGKQA